MASCVLVAGLDASTNCGEMTSLFGSAGTVVSTLVVSPAANGTPGAALVYFAEPNAAASAADLFDSFPFAGSLLEVRKAEAAAAARVLAALAEAQVSVAGAAPPVPAPQAPHVPEPALTAAASTAQPAPLAATTASPAVDSTNGPAGPMPAAPTPSAPAHLALSTSTSESIPEPPDFGGADYNPSDWLPPSDWQPVAATADTTAPAAPAAAVTAAGWATVTASRAQAPPPQQAAAHAGPGKPSSAAASADVGAQPEWQVDRRCRIYVTGLKPGCRAEDLRAYFSRFGELVDSAVVPKKCVGFLTYAKAASGEAAMEAVNGSSVPGLSPSGADPLSLEFRDLDKIRRHFHTKRVDVMDTPTTRLFIGYFPRGTKLRAVRAELERYGELTDMKLGGGDDGGDCYCFAQFRRVQDSARAKAAIHGRTMPAITGARQLIAGFKEPRPGH